VLSLAGLYVVLISVLGFLGQIFFGMFSLVATAASISAMLAVLFAAVCRGIPKCRFAVAGMTLVALSCAALDAIQYYRLYDSPGNYYPWDLQLPFIICLIVVGFAGALVSSESQA